MKTRHVHPMHDGGAHWLAEFAEAIAQQRVPGHVDDGPWFLLRIYEIRGTFLGPRYKGILVSWGVYMWARVLLDPGVS